MKLPYTDDPKFLKESEDGRFFIGYEARAGIGVHLHPEGLFALQFGYRLQHIDFDDVFVDDDSEGFYAFVRVFIPSE